MSDTSIETLYDLYLDTLSRCNSSTREKSDDDIAYDVWEEFWGGVRCFLYETTLAPLHEAGYIDDNLVQLSREINKRAVDLFESEWTIEEFKRDPQWTALVQLVDRALELNAHRSGDKSG